MSEFLMDQQGLPLQQADPAVQSSHLQGTSPHTQLPLALSLMQSSHPPTSYTSASMRGTHFHQQMSQATNLNWNPLVSEKVARLQSSSVFWNPSVQIYRQRNMSIFLHIVPLQLKQRRLLG
uniref:Uncharacterized protein n=1 Tax=Lotus japonicus TaxID=34305 RepID=I3SLG4_LOTJA|nr:unknown [Lotus japonicus]